MARDRAFRSNSFGISTTIAFAFCYTELTLLSNGDMLFTGISSS
ncbi:hypothetical protein LEP1GSC062_0438 [Leptospira alexanderi serovar Manhao 3 str. L 60]|uniref:Uncharacterized protein n=1 Tax=Leptospira alexanderi serovar Manhao 3 str. L 60 TaxID=1049759 RepID=V6I9M9_9LEPT|nr:hypothetical protein LEP1GSC062_0438 [Leptospira alexanderi serovar Manhao 3 str. L 60]